MKNGISTGLIAAVILAILYLIISAIAPKLNFMFTYAMLSSVAIYLFFMIRASNQEEAITKEFYGFGEALIPAMVCYAVASFIYQIFTFMMFKLDPAQLEYAQEAGLESIEFVANLIGDKDGAFIEQMEDSQEDILKQYTNIGTYFVNWFVSLIFPGLIIGAIAAKMARKKITTT